MLELLSSSLWYQVIIRPGHAKSIYPSSSSSSVCVPPHPPSKSCKMSLFTVPIATAGYIFNVLILTLSGQNGRQMLNCSHCSCYLVGVVTGTCLIVYKAVYSLKIHPLCMCIWYKNKIFTVFKFCEEEINHTYNRNPVLSF